LNDHYAVLGILPRATPEEVKQAYLRLAKIFHPDKNRSPDATKKMAEINLAYEILCDSQKRGEYDVERGFAATGVVEQHEEEEESGQEAQVFGRCIKCNFVNNSGVFVCSSCGYVYEPETKDRKDDYEEIDEEHDAGDAVSEIIRCPRCNEINTYSRGSCWQCGLAFEMEEAA
jgi:curved DNA-binding protein CbpA